MAVSLAVGRKGLNRQPQRYKDLCRSGRCVKRAAMKPALDGMAKAIGVDDALFRPLLIDKIKAESKDKARVEIELLSG